jgi:hypothetical protein
MNDSSYRLNFDLGKKNKIRHYSWKEHAKNSLTELVNCKVWLRNVVKCGKYSPAKFPNFVLICITCGKMHHIWAKSGAFSRA